MFELKLTQTIIEIKILGRVYKLSILKIIAMAILGWIIFAFVFCSCCTLTLTDVIDIGFEKLLNYFNGSDEVSVRVKSLQDKKCSCDSPWDSPCVVWGNKQVKEESCNTEGGCEDKSNVKGASEKSTSDKCASKSCSDDCDKLNSDDCPVRLDNAAQGNNVVDPFYNRGGNRSF